MILSQLFIFFTMPETKYNRTVTQVTVLPKELYSNTTAAKDVETSDDNALEKHKVEGLSEVWGYGKPSPRQWKLWSSPDKTVSIWELLSTPIIINMWPAVLYVY